MTNRTYHTTSSPYLLPNDIEEVDRLNLQHYLLRFVLKGNSFAPVSPDVQRVLDIGCGSGIWSEEMSHEFLDAEFDLIDLSAVFKNSESNRRLHFQQADILTGLPFPDNTFDYSFQRLLVAGLPTTEWPNVIKESVRVTKPGGWVEFVDSDFLIFNEGPILNRLQSWLVRILEKRGIDSTVVRKMETFFQDAGLTDVQCTKSIAPIGITGDQIDELYLKNYLSILGSMKPLLCAEGEISSEEFDSLHGQIRKECLEYKSYGAIYVTYGQKPL